jgi:hypothetical protein
MRLSSSNRPPHFVRTVEALQVAAIVAYARPFINSESVGRAAPIIPTKQIFKELPLLKELHKTIVQRRMQAAAHADWTHHQTVLMDAETPDSIARLSSRPDYWRGITTKDFQELIRHVCRCLDLQRIELDRSILEARLKPLLQYSFKVEPGARVRISVRIPCETTANERRSKTVLSQSPFLSFIGVDRV